MASSTSGSNGGTPADKLPLDPVTEPDEGYDPGDTLNRGMSIACSLILLFFALVSCGFIISVLSSHH